MHPADQFAAFAALVKEGRPIEDIAADFGVSPLVVQRRLTRANVPPRLLTDYRAGAATLEHLLALPITDDHTPHATASYGDRKHVVYGQSVSVRVNRRGLTTFQL